MVPREQHVRHPPASVISGTGVVRVFWSAFQRIAEGLLSGGLLVSQGARQLSQHCVEIVSVDLHPMTDLGPKLVDQRLLVTNDDPGALQGAMAVLKEVFGVYREPILF